MNSVLTRNEVEAGFTLLAWRSLTVAAETGLVVHVRSGVLRVYEGASSSPRIYHCGARFVARGGGQIRLKAYVNAELHVEWPERGLDRLSPGLEPLTWPAEGAPGAMEPIAQALRP